MRGAVGADGDDEPDRCELERPPPAAAKRTFVAYATVPVYTEFFRWLGRGDLPSYKELGPENGKG